MMENMTLIRRITTVSFAALLFLSTTASAMTLQEAKAAGLLGERADGYVGVVSDTPEANRIAEDMNAKRRTGYQDIAAERGLTQEEVEAVAGQRNIRETPGGEYIYTTNGWQRK